MAHCCQTNTDTNTGTNTDANVDANIDAYTDTYTYTNTDTNTNSCKMSFSLHRGNFLNQILPQEKHVNRDESNTEIE